MSTLSSSEKKMAARLCITYVDSDLEWNTDPMQEKQTDILQSDFSCKIRT